VRVLDGHTFPKRRARAINGGQTVAHTTVLSARDEYLREMDRSPYSDRVLPPHSPPAESPFPGNVGSRQTDAMESRQRPGASPAETVEMGPLSMIRLIVAGEHALVRDSVRLLCSTHADLCVIGEAADGQSAVELAEELQPDVLIVDVSMPRMNGVQVTSLVRQRAPDVKVLALTGLTDDLYIRELLRAGARGYALTQSRSADLLAGIRTVALGREYLDPALTSRATMAYARRYGAADATALSPREAEVLQLTAWGYRNTEIAARLSISVKTVEAHKSHGLEKLRLVNRVELTRFALLSGWFQGL
jgi:two-component system response regulator NreC